MENNKCHNIKYMEYNQSEPVVTERKSHLKLLIILLVSIVSLVALYQGYILYQKNHLPAYAPETLESFGLDTNIATSTLPTGVVYYSATIPNTENGDGQSHVYAYNLETESTVLLALSPMTDYIKINNDEALVLAPTSQYQEQSGWQPQIYNNKTETLKPLINVGGYNLKNLTMSPDGTRYAYSYQETMTAEDSKEILANRKVAVHSLNEAEIVTIDKADNLVWFNDGLKALYLSSDGIYQYSFETKQSELLFNGYSVFSGLDNINLSSDQQTVVLAKPDENIISYLTLVDGQLVEKGRAVKDDITYRHSVTSPDGKYLLTLAERIENINLVDDNYTYDSNYVAELRIMGSDVVIKTVPLNGEKIFNQWLIN